MTSFGDRLKELRKKSNLTQQELASKFYLNKSSISRYENGTQLPEHDLLEKIADYFKVSIDYLLGRTDIKDVPTNSKENENKKTSQPKLSEKDERDIKKDLNKTLEQLENSQDGLMFDGEPMDDETRELLRISLENSMRIAKQAAKKYTPKKYRK